LYCIIPYRHAAAGQRSNHHRNNAKNVNCSNIGWFYSIAALALSSCLLSSACERVDQQPAREWKQALPEPARTGTKERIRRLPPLGKEATEAESLQNYDWHDISTDGDGTLYVSDNALLCVHGLAVESGQETSRFGRKGQGPGEFAFIARVRYQKGLGLAVLDNILRRLTVFDRAGKVIHTVPLDRMSDDFAQIGPESLVVSSYSLEHGYKPLRTISLANGNVGSEFGVTIEPQVGIRAKISLSPAGAQDMLLYSFAGMTRVLFIPHARIMIYAQRHPYFLILFGDARQAGKRIDVALPFSTADSMEYSVKQGQRTATIHPSGAVLDPLYVKKQDAVIVAAFDSSAQTNVLDIYNLEGQLRERLPLPPLGHDIKPVSATLLRDSVLAILVRNKDRICWIERFSIMF
jgi:hypothetical protein